jgi:hypothetical protein
MADYWKTWTPSWTNLTVGNGTVTGVYRWVGRLVFCRLSIVFGSTTSISGDVKFTLPDNRAANAGTANATPMGQVSMFDTSAGAVFSGTIVNSSTTLASCRVFNASGTYLTEALLTASVPFTWTTGDEINAQFFYESA